MLSSAGAAYPAARRATLVACAFVSMVAPSLQGGLLYFTEFEDPPFVSGPDNWAGTDGWIANSTGLGVHGIDDDKFLDNNQTAFLGFEQPDTLLVVVAKPLDHDPVLENTDRIQIDALLGVEDSSNGFRDSFWITIYNIAGELLGALRLSNELGTYGIWRYDGVNEFDTGLAFIHGELHLFCIEIDFQNNRWKADLDGIPLFSNALFTATNLARDFGSMSYEWQLTSDDVTEHGDNWMLVADTIVWAIPPGEKNFQVDQVSFDSAGQPQIEFTGEPGWTYQVQYTDNLLEFFQDLPGSTFTGIATPAQIQFSDPTTRRPSTRWYRVVRTVTP